jgi:hypothetical protein
MWTSVELVPNRNLSSAWMRDGEIVGTSTVWLHPANLPATVGSETQGREKCEAHRTSAFGGVEPALYLRCVCWINTAFHGHRCHPLTCMLLKIHLTDNSNPRAPTIPPKAITLSPIWLSVVASPLANPKR